MGSKLSFKYSEHTFIQREPENNQTILYSNTILFCILYILSTGEGLYVLLKEDNISGAKVSAPKVNKDTSEEYHQQESNSRAHYMLTNKVANIVAMELERETDAHNQCRFSPFMLWSCWAMSMTRFI